MAFSPEFLEELRLRAGVIEVVGKRVQLQRRGRDLIGLCPFHTEKTPSFHVYEDHYHCFGCGAHGSVFDFVMQTEGLSFPEAVERLAAAAGMQVPVDTPEEQERQHRRDTLHEVLEAACRWFEKALRMPEGRAGLAYLQRRGLDETTIRRFRLGFAPDSRTALKAALAREGVDEPRMVEAGLLVRPEEGGRAPYDRFRGRVMFPIEDRKGRVIAFGGRIIGDGEPKYLNSPETPVFHKGYTLYNIAKAVPAARKSGSLVICEGYMDVIALDRAGFPHAVAPLGTALTPQQIQELWRVVPEPVLCFDGDAAGQKAMARAAENALAVIRPGYGLKFAVLPAGEDPDSLIGRSGAEAMKGVLDHAERLSDVLWRLETGVHAPSTPEGLAALRQRFEDLSRRIGDATFRGYFAKWFKDRIWKESAAVPKPRRSKGAAPLRDIASPAAARRPLDAGAMRKRVLVAALLLRPELFDEVAERLGRLDIEDARLDKLRQELLKTLAGHPTLDSSGLQSQLCGHGFSEDVNWLLSRSVLMHGAFARPDVPADEVRAGWEGVFALLARDELGSEVAMARQQAGKDMTSESFGRVGALRIQQQTNHLTDDEPDAGTADGRPDR